MTRRYKEFLNACQHIMKEVLAENGIEGKPYIKKIPMNGMDGVTYKRPDGTDGVIFDVESIFKAFGKNKDSEIAAYGRIKANLTTLVRLMP